MKLIEKYLIKLIYYLNFQLPNLNSLFDRESCEIESENTNAKNPLFISFQICDFVIFYIYVIKKEIKRRNGLYIKFVRSS